MISVVVPVYNAEKYLDRCINSIVNQTYTDIEIILVNDGSKDNSLKICNTWAKKDKRIKVLDQENQGVSVARNNGIKNSSGDYLYFIDSDDYIVPLALETTNIEKTLSDIVIFPIIFIYEDKNIKMELDKNLVSIKDFLTNLNDYKNLKLILSSPVNKLYKLNIIKENNIKFKESINFGEDLLFNLNYLLYCEKINILNEFLYNYDCTNENSLIHNIKINKNIILSAKLTIKIVKELFTNNNIDLLNYIEYGHKFFENLFKHILLSDLNLKDKYFYIFLLFRNIPKDIFIYSINQNNEYSKLLKKRDTKFFYCYFKRLILNKKIKQNINDFKIFIKKHLLRI